MDDFVEIDEHLIISKLALTLGVVDLLDVSLYLLSCLLISLELQEVLEEILNLSLDGFVLAILDVEVENPPDIFWVELRLQFVLLVHSDVGNIESVRPDETEHLLNLGGDTLDSNLRDGFLGCLESVDYFSVNPLSLILKFFFGGIKTVIEFYLQTLGNVPLLDLSILRSPEVVVVLRLEGILQFELLLFRLINISRCFTTHDLPLDRLGVDLRILELLSFRLDELAHLFWLIAVDVLSDELAVLI